MSTEIHIEDTGRRWYSSETGLGTAAALLAVVLLFAYFVML